MRMQGQLFKILLTGLLIVIPIATLATKKTEENDYEGQLLVERGKQLVAEGKCNQCHTPYVVSSEGDNIPDPTRLLSGHPADAEVLKIPTSDLDSERWLEFLYKLPNTARAGPWGISFAANLTPDPSTGIGKWDEDIFMETMRSGIHISLKRDILPPMPWEDYSKLSDRDLKAIFAYLGTLKPVENPVPSPIPLPGKKSSPESK